MLNFVPPPNDRKKRKERDDVVLPDEDAEKEVRLTVQTNGDT